jgi:hypothetical protein
MPKLKIVIKKSYNILNGINIAIIADKTINGPNGTYSLDFFTFTTNSKMLTTAPSKNAITDTVKIEFNP